MAADRPSAMVRRFGRLQGYVARRLTEHVHLDPRALAGLRSRGEHGTLVYVLRHRSLLDYLLLNWLMLREGLPLARFANGVSSRWFVTLGEMFRRIVRRLRHAPLGTGLGQSLAERREIAELVEAGEPVLVFLRARHPRLLWNSRSRLGAARRGRELLQEIVARASELERPVYLVPICFSRGRRFRRQGSRLSALAYSVHDAPSDLKKLVTYRFNRDDLLLAIGRVIDLGKFLNANRTLGVGRAARRLTNSLQRELAQEERAVWGPLLQSRHVMAERVFEGRDVAVRIDEIARVRNISSRRAWREAKAYFWEMAANFNGFAFGIIEILFHQIWKRTFSGVEVRGLDRIVDCVKQHPVVLVPCHRSHFDYMVLSYIFRQHFLSPPHIAAGINMSFWPVSSLLRGSGAFFIHRTFEDNELYKLVFHRYLAAMIREGYTLEFFIEGGRSRTGKILTPKLGMLSGLVRAFLQGVRRDLYLVPVSISYGRIAEESAYDAELSGQSKQRESLGALLRARSVLQQRHGTVYVSFGDPMSMRGTLGDRLERFRADPAEPEIEEEKRRFIQKLGFRILREVNEVAIVGATSLTATVLLSATGGTCGFHEYVTSARSLAELLRWRGVALSPSLERNLGKSNFGEITGFLASSKLIEIEENGEGRRLRVPPARRKVLDFYKNNSIHFFLLPSLVAHACLRGLPGSDLKDELWWWLSLFRWEFPLPEREEMAAEAGRLLEYFRAHGAGFDGEGGATVPLVQSLSPVLENFREAYWIAVRTASRLEGEEIPESQLGQRMQRHFEAAMLLGEVLKPEAASSITFGNAISRLVEIGCLERRTRKNARDRWIRRGERFEELDRMAHRIGGALLIPRDRPVVDNSNRVIYAT
jgi:glycerol-3-phosphate O-acyltransferase